MKLRLRALKAGEVNGRQVQPGAVLEVDSLAGAELLVQRGLAHPRAVAVFKFGSTKRLTTEAVLSDMRINRS